MEMRGARMFGMCGLVIVALGCGKVSKDHSKVVANIEGEKVTEKSFEETMNILFPNNPQVKELFSNPDLRPQRNRQFQEIVDQKTMIKYGEKLGLDKDPKVKLLVEAAKSNAYAQVLIDRKIGEPTDAELKAVYDRVVAKSKAAGNQQAPPPFEAVKAQVATMWQREKLQTISQEVIKDSKAKVACSVDPQWKVPEPVM